MRFQSSLDPPRYIQVGILHGGVDNCGNEKFPNIYARLEDEEIWTFVMQQVSPRSINQQSLGHPVSIQKSSKILLAKGAGANGFEVLSLSDPEEKCSDFPTSKNLYGLGEVLGGLVKDVDGSHFPLLCIPKSSKCVMAHNDTKFEHDFSLNLNKSRKDSFSMVSINDEHLWVTDGISIDIISALGAKTGPTLPFQAEMSCLIQIYTDKIMLIGWDKTLQKNRYFIYDLALEKWSYEMNGPPGSEIMLQCARFEMEGDPHILIAGTESFNYNTVTQQWEEGPTLPNISSFKLLTNLKSNGVFLIGGAFMDWDNLADLQYSDAIYEMTTYSMRWRKIPSKLNVGRAGQFAVMYLPETLTTCWKAQDMQNENTFDVEYQEYEG